MRRVLGFEFYCIIIDVGEGTKTNLENLMTNKEIVTSKDDEKAEKANDGQVEKNPMTDDVTVGTGSDTKRRYGMCEIKIVGRMQW